MDRRYFINWHSSEIVYCNGTYYKTIKDAIREANYLRKTDPFYKDFYCCQIVKKENGVWIESNIFEKLITF